MNIVASKVLHFFEPAINHAVAGSTNGWPKNAPVDSDEISAIWADLRTNHREQALEAMRFDKLYRTDEAERSAKTAAWKATWDTYLQDKTEAEEFGLEPPTEPVPEGSINEVAIAACTARIAELQKELNEERAKREELRVGVDPAQRDARAWGRVLNAFLGVGRTSGTIPANLPLATVAKRFGLPAPTTPTPPKRGRKAAPKPAAAETVVSAD